MRLFYANKFILAVPDTLLVTLFRFCGEGKFCGKPEYFALNQNVLWELSLRLSSRSRMARNGSLLLVVVKLDAQRLQKLQILIADVELGIGAERGD